MVVVKSLLQPIPVYPRDDSDGATSAKPSKRGRKSAARHPGVRLRSQYVGGKIQATHCSFAPPSDDDITELRREVLRDFFHHNDGKEGEGEEQPHEQQQQPRRKIHSGSIVVTVVATVLGPDEEMSGIGASGSQSKRWTVARFSVPLFTRSERFEQHQSPNKSSNKNKNEQATENAVGAPDDFFRRLDLRFGVEKVIFEAHAHIQAVLLERENTIQSSPQQKQHPHHKRPMQQKLVNETLSMSSLNRDSYSLGTVLIGGCCIYGA